MVSTRQPMSFSMTTSLRRMAPIRCPPKIAPNPSWRNPVIRGGRPQPWACTYGPPGSGPAAPRAGGAGGRQAQQLALLVAVVGHQPSEPDGLLGPGQLDLLA